MSLNFSNKLVRIEFTKPRQFQIVWCFDIVNIIQQKIILNARNIENKTAEYDLVRKMRASILVLGPLLSRFKEAKISLPCGCAIGTRPIDIHLSALSKLGVNFEIENGFVKGYVRKNYVDP